MHSKNMSERQTQALEDIYLYISDYFSRDRCQLCLYILHRIGVSISIFKTEKLILIKSS